MLREGRGGGGGGGAGGGGALEGVPEVDIAEGTWKYVQIRLRGGGGSEKTVVRNTAGLPYHPDMYDHAMRALRPLGISGTVVGGGRIAHDPGARTVDVYGYSKSFGRAAGCNERSADIIRRNLPGYTVTWSDEGY